MARDWCGIILFYFTLVFIFLFYLSLYCFVIWNRSSSIYLRCAGLRLLFILFIPFDLLLQQEEMGAGFHDAYVALLRDTGRMSAEEVVQKHLGADIEGVEFWRGSIRIIEAKIDAFEQALKESGVQID